MTGKGQRKAKYISQNMRIIARLLIELHKISNTDNKDMTSYLSAGHFDDIVKATKTLAGHKPVNTDGKMIRSFAIPFVSV